MATIVQRGLAAVAGVAGTITVATVAIYPVSQRIRGTQDYEEEIVKDVNGFDAAWLARNEHEMFEISMKLLGDTLAHAETPITTDVSNLGQPFMLPFEKCILSGFQLSCLNGTFQNITGNAVDLENTKSGDVSYRLRKYADATQNTSANTVPA